MRIGLFTETYEPVQNGVSVSVKTLAEELRVLHHRVVIVAPQYPHYVDESRFVLRIPSMLTPFSPTYPLSYPFMPLLQNKLRRLEPNILHSHNPFFTGMLAANIAKANHIPLVSTYHTLYNHYGHYLIFLPQQAVDGLLEWWLPEYYNRCACVICPSRLAEESLRGYRIETRVEVIPTAVPLPNPADLTEFVTQTARQRWQIPAEAPLLLYAGRIAQEKNVQLVLQVFAALESEIPDARLLIAGGGPYLDTLKKKAAELPGADRVIFAGPTPRNELDPVFAAADIFVFPSSTETQGLVIAEARAAGTPCVVVSEGGAAETVSDGEDGLVVPPDLEAFTGAVRHLLQNRGQLKKMSEACLRNAKNYTPSVMAERMLRVYDRAIAESRHGKAL